MIELLSVDPRPFVDAFKQEYYNQTGKTLQIGSDEFAAASVYAYVMSVFFNQVNENTRNRFIDYATGEYLDAIAAMYGIYERPEGYHASCLVRVNTPNIGATVPANSIVLAASNGDKFTNKYPAKLTNPAYILFESVNPGTKYNGIPAGDITEIVQGDIFISSAQNTTITDGGTDGFSSDDEYRSWLKMQIRSFAGAGTYMAYEARAKNSDPRVTDVYVLRQDDPGYQKGSVKIYYLSDQDTDHGDVYQKIVESCNDPSFRPIGDEVIVSYAQPETKDLGGVEIQVTYPKRFEGVGRPKANAIYTKYKNELLNKINKPFVFEELCSRFAETDDDGVFAYDAKPVNIAGIRFPEPVYPAAGHVLDITNIYISIVYSDRGA